MKLHWLTPLRREQAPVTFGVPWGRGQLARTQTLTLTAMDGRPTPVQQKPLAYWPDGSVKWMALSALADTRVDLWQVQKGAPCAPQNPVRAQVSGDGAVTAGNGLVEIHAAAGQQLVGQINRKGFEPMGMQAVALLQRVSGDEDGDETRVTQRFTGKNESVTLEEAGPVRAVVRLRGCHEGGGRRILPYDVRLYVYAGSDEVRIVHNFMLDIREKEELLHGVAVTLAAPVSGELFNRHIGFAGDTGLFYEGAQCLFSSAHYRTAQDRAQNPLPMDENVARYARQIQDGQFFNLERRPDDPFALHVDDNAAWDRFLLSQDSSQHFSIAKRTRKGCAMITAAQGDRSAGAMFFGCPSAICAVAVKDFWQKAPTALEVAGARGDRAVLTAWLYSKYGESYDFGAYDTVSHRYSYGGINNYPYGIANTNEITVKFFGAMPGKQAIWDFARDVQDDALLVGDLDLYAGSKALGSYWLPPKEGQAGDAACEKALENLVHFYIDEVERRRWYGFWDYGDVMHSYDIVRHCWLYDTGGRAWQNTELCNTYVNWLLFLRTGDYAIYRFARAMSRHCSEVDVYHSGKYAMLGTRHNVRHWGCGAKEARISMAGHHRFFYYLTADERIGDVMDAVRDVDQSTLNETGRDPMGSYFPAHPNFSHIRIGPDWSSFVSNWMTRWERFEDPVYRDKIYAGLNTIKKAPLRMASGSTFHYDPKTGQMHYMGAPNPAGHTHLGDGNYQQHMVVCFGGPETFFELAEILDDPEFTDMLAQLASYYFMTPQQRTQASGGLFCDENMRAWRGEKFGVRMRAFSGWYDRNPEETAAAVNMMIPDYQTGASPVIQGGVGMFRGDGSVCAQAVAAIDAPAPTVEVPSLTTNDAAQWSLNYMESAHFQQLTHDGETPR